MNFIMIMEVKKNNKKTNKEIAPQSLEYWKNLNMI